MDETEPSQGNCYPHWLHSSGGLYEKCSSYSHVFKHLVLDCWNYLGGCGTSRRQRLAGGDMSLGGSFEGLQPGPTSCLLLCSDENMVTQLSAPAFCHAFHNSLCLPSHARPLSFQNLKPKQTLNPINCFLRVFFFFFNHSNRNKTVTVSQFGWIFIHFEDLFPVRIIFEVIWEQCKKYLQAHKDLQSLSYFLLRYKLNKYSLLKT